MLAIHKQTDCGGWQKATAVNVEMTQVGVDVRRQNIVVGEGDAQLVGSLEVTRLQRFNSRRPN